MAQVTNQIFYATTYHPIQAGSIDGTDTAAHDNGIYRALLASSTGLYDPTGDPKAEGDPYCTLFVGRLARHTTEETLELVMSKFGKVKHIRLVRHIVTGASQGYGFVEFETEKEMLLAYEMAHCNVIDGSQIIVDYNRQQLMRGWIPRRLGGGLGGRKESGQLRFGGRDRPFRAPLRPIPEEQLIKLGIPLPPVGRYMSRFLLPPVPRRPDNSKETPRRHSSSQKDFRRETPHFEPAAGDKRHMERVSSRSPARRSKGGERPGDEVKPSSSSRHRKGRHSVEEDRDSDDYGNRVGKHAGEKTRMDRKDNQSSVVDEESRGRFRRYEGGKSHRDNSSELVDDKESRERLRRYEGEKAHRDRRDDSSELVDEKESRERLRRYEGEESHRDRRDNSSELVDEKESRERFRRYEGEKSHRDKRLYSSEAVEEDHYEQRYTYSGAATARYEHSSGNEHGADELRAPGYGGSRDSERNHEGREGRRSLSLEGSDYEKRSAENERKKSNHRHEKKDKKRSRSRESADYETRSSRYEEAGSKSRHRREGREHKRSHSKHRET